MAAVTKISNQNCHTVKNSTEINSDTKIHTSEKVDVLPPWKVILLNDNHSEFNMVVQVVSKIMKWSVVQSFQKVLIAHTQGQCLLCCAHREKAEFYQQQFANYNINIAIEKA